MKKLKKLNTLEIVSRAGQLFGIAVLCVMFYAIIQQHISIIISILRDYPGEFWRNYIWVLIENIGG